MLEEFEEASILSETIGLVTSAERIMVHPAFLPKA